MQRRALVIYSGGLDSTVCLLKAKKEFNSVEALTFHYMQRHATEVRAAERICRKLNVPQKILELKIPFESISNTTLVAANGFSDVSAPYAGKESLPSSFVPGRNLIFIILAAAYADTQGLTHIITGVNNTDYSGYPDCRPQAVEKLSYAIASGMEIQIPILTPLMKLSKFEIIKLGFDLGMTEDLFNQTVSCYNGRPGAGCGECPSCKIRNAALLKFNKEFYK